MHRCAVTHQPQPAVVVHAPHAAEAQAPVSAPGGGAWSAGTLASPFSRASEAQLATAAPASASVASAAARGDAM
jgi:hypothetical protein